MPFSWGTAGLAYMDAAEKQKKFEAEQAKIAQDEAFRQKQLEDTKAENEKNRQNQLTLEQTRQQGETARATERLRADEPLRQAQIAEANARRAAEEQQRREANIKADILAGKKHYSDWNDAILQGGDALKSFASKNQIDITEAQDMTRGMLRVKHKNGQEGVVVAAGDAPPISISIPAAKFLYDTDLRRSDSEIRKAYEKANPGGDWAAVAPALPAMRMNQGITQVDPSPVGDYLKQAEMYRKQIDDMTKERDRLADNMDKASVPITDAEGKMLAAVGIGGYEKIGSEAKPLKISEASGLIDQIAQAKAKIDLKSEAGQQQDAALASFVANISPQIKDYNTRYRDPYITTLNNIAAGEQYFNYVSNAAMTMMPREEAAAGMSALGVKLAADRKAASEKPAGAGRATPAPTADEAAVNSALDKALNDESRSVAERIDMEKRAKAVRDLQGGRLDSASAAQILQGQEPDVLKRKKTSTRDEEIAAETFGLTDQPQGETRLDRQLRGLAGLLAPVTNAAKQFKSDLADPYTMVRAATRPEREELRSMVEGLKGDDKKKYQDFIERSLNSRADSASHIAAVKILSKLYPDKADWLTALADKMASSR